MLDEAHAELKARLASTEERLFHAEERLSALQMQHAELEEKRDALQSDLGVSVAHAAHSSIVLSCARVLCIPYTHRFIFVTIHRR